MSADERAILDAISAMQSDVEAIGARLARLETALELVRRHVVRLGERTTALEGDMLTPPPVLAAA